MNGMPNTVNRVLRSKSVHFSRSASPVDRISERVYSHWCLLDFLYLGLSSVKVGCAMRHGAGASPDLSGDSVIGLWALVMRSALTSVCVYLSTEASPRPNIPRYNALN